jgi:hypothetical protein
MFTQIVVFATQPFALIKATFSTAPYTYDWLASDHVRFSTFMEVCFPASQRRATVNVHLFLALLDP